MNTTLTIAEQVVLRDAHLAAKARKEGARLAALAAHGTDGFGEAFEAFLAATDEAEDATTAFMTAIGYERGPDGWTLIPTHDVTPGGYLVPRKTT